MTSSFTQLQMWWLAPNPYWINAFMKAPLFPWPHIISGLQSPHSHGKPQRIPPSRTQSDASKLNFIASRQKRHILRLSRDSEMTFLWQLFLYYRSTKANINCHKQLKYLRLSEIGIVLSQQSTHSAVMVIKLVSAVLWKERASTYNTHSAVWFSFIGSTSTR